MGVGIPEQSRHGTQVPGILVLRVAIRLGINLVGRLGRFLLGLLLGSEDIVVDLVHDGLDVVLHLFSLGTRSRPRHNLAHNDIGAKLVRLVLQRRVLFKDDRPDVSGSLAEALIVLVSSFPCLRTAPRGQCSSHQ